MTISKTKIKNRAKKKTNSELVETLMLAEKNKLWELAKRLSSPRRKMTELNLEEVNKETKENETVLIPGKVLGKGNITKKIKIVALGFSSSAEEKLKKSGCEISTIKEELEKNKTLKGVRILK